MNANEVGLLLGLMALGDNRKPPEDPEGRKAMIDFWLRMVGDLDYAEAAQAVQEHYRQSRDWIMPKDIRDRVKASRSARLAKTPPPPPPPSLADDPGRYQQALRARIERIAAGFSVPKAIGGPLPGGPPPAWSEAREAAGPAGERPRRDPQEIALEQAAESRAERKHQGEAGAA